MHISRCVALGLGGAVTAASALAAQQADGAELVRERVQAWFAARAAGADSADLRWLAACAQRAWPAGARGRAGLADPQGLRQLFAGAFAYPKVAAATRHVSLPRAEGVRVLVPAAYQSDQPVPLVVRVWPNTRELAAVKLDVGPEPGLGTAIVVSATPRQLEAMVRVLPRRDLGGALQDALVEVIDVLGASGLAARARVRDPDEDLVQRGLFALLGAVQRQFHVDRDRVVLDCAGSACRSGLRAVTSAPDRFAGLVLRAVPKLPAVALDNLAGVPVLLLRGARTIDDATALRRQIDRIAEVESWEAETTTAARVARWCAERRRELMRSRVALVMRDDARVDGYWLADVVAESGDATGAGSARIDVRLDRELGVIQVECRRVDRFTLLLNDELLDLDRPFLLEVNGIGVMLQRTPSFSFLCETVFERFDPGFLFTTEVTVDVPRRG